ncbi:ribonuclease Z [Saprospiraceae bacterium]|nr:ribonuclease Z [Saprospiraceae bacterium]MDC3220085.1 ribonuclease Z [Saprospiraceae bacterium]
MPENMKFELTILGCNSAIPANNRFPTAQVLNVRGQLYLIDCGEGTQIRLRDNRIRGSRINQIFISHLHGDHIFGLIGVLSSYGLNGRKERLHIYCPPHLDEIINIQLKYTGHPLPYPIEFHITDPEKNQLIFEDKVVEVYTIPLTHRIPTQGFLFIEKRQSDSMIPQKIKAYNIPFKEIQSIKDGNDWVNSNGETVTHSELTTPAPKSRSYAFCSDTMYNESIVSIIEGADLLYHESTFLHSELEFAIKTKHSTSLQAATIAQKAKVGKLILGHYSSRYVELDKLLDEAKSVFPNTELGLEGKRFEVKMSKNK